MCIKALLPIYVHWKQLITRTRNKHSHTKGSDRKMYNKDETINSSTKITLTPEQSRAVYSDSHHIAIIAGAGSGKTRVLTRKW